MKPAELAAVLREFHREKLALRERHVAVAREVADYEFNNTYQYIIAREDMQLGWLEAALAELGATPDQVGEPALPRRGKKDSFMPLIQQDTSEAAEFVNRWRPRLDAVTHARHRGMMHVILGETMEHKRFFDQMIAGRDDLLGRRSNGPGKDGTGDGMLPVRWMK